jgi:DNA-binding response OmpR family regulator
MKNATKNILIVDNNPGFIFWLGDVLIGADYQPWPACNASDAISVAGRKPQVRVDLLIVNASLSGVSKLIAHLRRTQPQVRVMALGPQDETLAGVNAWQLTPGFSDDSAKQEFIKVVKHMSGGQNRAA